MILVTLQAVCRADISALVQNKQKQLQSCREAAPTRLSPREAVVALTEGPCARRPPPLMLCPKTA